MSSDPIRVRTALISVWDKQGVVELGRSLVDRGIALISSGGTARALRGGGGPRDGHQPNGGRDRERNLRRGGGAAHDAPRDA